MKDFNSDSIAEITRKQTLRTSISNGAKQVAKKVNSKAISKGAGAVAKGAANPGFIVGDVLELGVETITGCKNAGRATSAAVYLGAGAAIGGPVGAGVAAAVWGVGQAIDYALSREN